MTGTIGLGGIMPGQFDSVTIPQRAGNNPSKMDLQNLHLANLSLVSGYQGNLSITTQTLHVDGLLTHDGGTLTIGAGSLLTVHQFVLASGAVAGPGNLSITGTAQDRGALDLLQPKVIGLPSITVDANSDLILDANITFNTTQINLQGHTEWLSGKIRFDNGSVFKNYGLFDAKAIATQGYLSTDFAANPFENYGVFQKTTAGITSVSANFANKAGGVILVAAGDLGFEKESSNAGAWQILTGASLTLEKGLHAIVSSAASITGGGTLIVDWGARLEAAPGVTVTTSAVLHLKSADTALTGGAGFISQTKWIWERGAIANTTVSASGEVYLQNDDFDIALNAATFNNYGTTIWTGTKDVVLNAGTINNHATFDIRSNSVLRPEGAGGAFHNLATLPTMGEVKKTAGAGQTTISVQFDTAGILQLFSGSLRIEAGFTQQGTSSVTDLAGHSLLMGLGAEFKLLSGTVRGGGTIGGNLNNTGGIVEVGDNQNQRTLTVTGDYGQNVGGKAPRLCLRPVDDGEARRHGPGAPLRAGRVRHAERRHRRRPRCNHP